MVAIFVVTGLAVATWLVSPVATPSGQDAAPPVEAEAVRAPVPTFGVGAQVFLRGQGRFNPDLDRSEGTRSHLGQPVERFRAHVDAQYGPVAAFVQVQEARTFTFERDAATNDGAVTIHQGFAELAGERRGGRQTGSVRAGRQEIAWGRERLIGPLLWLPGARSFDAVRLEGTLGPWTLDAFAAYRMAARVVQVPVDPDMPDGPTAPVDTSVATGLGGARLEWSAFDAIAAEAIVLVDFSDAHPTELGEEHGIVDMGGRAWGSYDVGVTWDLEGHGQVGRRNDLEHRAWAWAVAGDWKAQWQRRVRPGIGGGLAMASGDACVGSPDDGCGTATRRDFFNFYPTNHIHYGMVDLLGWSNMRDFEIRQALAFGERFDLTVAAHFFQLQQSRGRWMNAGGAPVGAGWDPANTDNDLGHEVDVVGSAKLFEPLKLSAGYGAFVPAAAAIRLLGPDPQHFVYLWVVLTLGSAGR